MEVEGLGARCALATCRRLDYLPYRCASCGLEFCDAHRAAAAHSCAAAAARTVPTCPLCAVAVPVAQGMTADAAVSRHIDAGCPKRRRANPPCALPSCGVRDPAATPCVACRRVFCVAHCVEVNHGCTVTSTATPVPARSVFGIRRGSRTVTPKQTSKPSTAAGAVADKSRGSKSFLNASSNPIGDSNIEPENKIILAVHFPPSSNLAPRFMVFNNKNSAGKIIDVIHKLVSNLPSPPSGSRYSLYAVKGDLTRVNLLPYITPLRELGGVVQSGDSLVLQVGDSGLDPAAMKLLQPVAAPIFTAPPLGRRIPKLQSKKSLKCLVA